MDPTKKQIIGNPHNRPHKHLDSTKPVKQKTQRKRRTRSAAGERNYVCGCGKAYLSYPALYTHVKNKHEGTFPEGSIVKKGSKRPEDEIEDYVTAEKLSYKNEIRGFLRRLKNAYSENSVMSKEQIMQEFPKEFFFNKLDYLALQKALSLMMMKDYREGNPNNPDIRAQNQRMSCDEVFARFILDFTTNVTRRFCKEFLLFVCLIRKAYNEHGFAIKRKLNNTGHHDPIEATNFCEGKDMSLLPELSNFFISELFPVYFSSLSGKDDLNYIGIKDSLIINIVFLVKFLCNWLLIHNFTILKLEINTEP